MGGRIFSGIIAVAVLALCTSVNLFASGKPEASSQSAAPQGQKSTVVVWAAGDDARFLQQTDFVKRFESQNPTYTISLEQFPWDGVHDKLVAGFAGGVLPDVAEAADQWVGEFSYLNALAPLDDYKAKMKYQDSQFLPGSWEHFRFIDGKIYAAPSMMEIRVLFYRTDLLKAAGIDSPPTTLAQLMDDGKKLSNGVDHFGLTDQTQWLDFHFFSWLLYAEGGNLFNSAATTCTLTDPAAIQALTYYKNLYDNNVIPKDPSKRAEAFKGFKEGYYAMAESGPWWLGLLAEQAPELKGKWAVAPLPADKTTISYGHPNAWVVPAGAKNKTGGEAWISFWLLPQVQADWHVDAGYFPVTLAAYDDPRLANDGVVQTFLSAAKRGSDSIHNVPNAEQITQVVWNMLSQVKDGKASPTDAATAACQAITPLLKR